MKIVVDASRSNEQDRTFRRFTIGLINDLAKSGPQHQFMVIAAKDFLNEMSSNIEGLPFKRSGFKWLDEASVGKLIKKTGAAKIIRVGASGLSVHMADKIYSSAAVSTINFLFFGDELSVEKETSHRYLPAVPEACLTDLSWAAAESIRTQYSAGKSYFLFVGEIADNDNVIGLLKAFSVFKKWQQSGMQLVIAGEHTRTGAALNEKLGDYKYRNDVIVLTNLPDTEISRLAAAAYAILYPAGDAIFPLGILLAVHSKKALVAVDTPFNRSFAHKASWIDPKDIVNGFGKAMINLYRDEALLHELELPGQTTLTDRGQMISAILEAIDE